MTNCAKRLIVSFCLSGVMFSGTCLRAQQADSTHADSLGRTAFRTTNVVPYAPSGLERTIDLVLSGGAGLYDRGSTSGFQAMANADFFARTSSLNLTAGFHFGFSKPATEGLTLGLRFPISETDPNHGIFADVALLVTDNGQDSDAFQTGLRGALAARSGLFEYRLAAEFRRLPFSGGPLEAWGGVEAGFAFNLLREGIREPSRKDSLWAALKYIASAQDFEDLQRVQSSAELDRWLDSFWESRNPTGSPRNEVREEYMRRIRFANEHYGTEHHLGVATDMGRVLLLYGEPDRTENAFSTVSQDRKYQLWVMEGRVKGYQTAIFLFVALEGGRYSAYYVGQGGFREVYSNVRGEYSDGIPSDLPPAMLNYVQTFGR
ncbi:MAG: GWxTD domain-containing protein [Bacteroidota bacterium]|nr:GWxTD domain-containing protein [Bacteroidota bacterium]MDP4233456.1 GWxTD domain-containing protein [Bacteroidota bacterium]MDP4242322.1 GWxTD domain-containing protein [Bacteroidota bacterium]MDP4287078.1 GWxTD domain-containing protein [Bacteroidota bacterium]